ncbi:MAG: hypothetical protein SVT52_02095 [Planctomycetota bacterium]|nr:hypothetical protein [Planctomycetota bacterium]
MTGMEILGSAAYLAMAVLVALIVFVLVRGPMRRLLSANSRLTECRAFFIRALLVILLLVALGLVAGETVTLPEDSAPMEYVWQAAGELDAVFGWAGGILGGYVLILTILAVGLGRCRD